MLDVANTSKLNRSYMVSAETDREFWRNAKNYYTEEQIAKMAKEETQMRKKVFKCLDDKIKEPP
jgi:hypothetical protein